MLVSRWTTDANEPDWVSEREERAFVHPGDVGVAIERNGEHRRHSSDLPRTEEGRDQTETGECRQRIGCKLAITSYARTLVPCEFYPLIVKVECSVIKAEQEKIKETLKAQEEAIREVLAREKKSSADDNSRERCYRITCTKFDLYLFFMYA